MKSESSQVLAVMGLLMLAGCQSGWQPEANFGSSVQGAIRAQIVDPTAPDGNANKRAKMDGESAKKTVDSYQKSFGATGSGDTVQGGSMAIFNK